MPLEKVSNLSNNYLVDIIVDNSGNVYVADWGNQRIQKFTTNGTYLTHWGSASSGDGEFDRPLGIAVDGSGNVYVADWGNQRIQKFTTSGTYLTQWSNQGSGDSLRGIATDGRSNVYVVDWENSYIRKFSTDGIYLTHWGGSGSGEGEFDGPTDVAVDGSGNVYVADWRNQRIQKFTADGVYLTQWVSTAGNGRFDGPGSVAVDDSGNVYVEVGNRRIQKFTNEGIYLAQWGRAGDGDGQFDGVGDIAVDSSGNVYVADWGNQRIQKFTADGVFQTKWGSFAHGYGESSYPTGVAVDDNGIVYVTTQYNNLVQKFTLGYPTPDPVSGPIHNGSFEVSPMLAEWMVGGSLPVSRVAIATNGNYALRLGAAVPQTEQDLGEAWAHQTIYVDPAWTRPRLSFKYRLFVNDILDYSDFFVAIQDGVGLSHLATVLRDGYQPCIPGTPPPPGKDLGWRSATYDLSAFKGQHIRIVFSNRNLWPESWGIWSLVDDVRVVDAGPQDTPTGAERAYLPIVPRLRCDPVTATRNVRTFSP